MRLASAMYHSDSLFGINDVDPIKDHMKLTKDHVLLLHGGEDISPSIYREKPNSYVHADKHCSLRDVFELACIDRAIELEIPIIGICRGAQLLCCVDGGSLVQHMVGHPAHHQLIDINLNTIYSNSAHHQMMMPSKYAEVLAIDSHPIKGIRENDKEEYFEHCPEIVFFPNIKGLGIQGHPEWMRKSHFHDYCTALINKYLIKE
jgi:gamma-glutamyl-gamma-aminobutyrate hydrolase PuuD